MPIQTRITPLHDEWLHLAIVFAACLLVYLATLPHHITLEDAGLFQMVCYTNGIAHPPGYPLHTLLCAPWVHLPVASPLILGNALSSVFGAFTCAVTYLITMTLLRQRSAAYVAALALGCSSTFWSQSIIIEVYTLNSFLYALLFYLCLRYQRASSPGLLVGISLTLGLALSNHWPLIVLSGPGLLMLMIPTYKATSGYLRNPATCLKMLLAFSLGLTPYLLMVLKKHPQIALLGEISNLDEFVSYVLRQSYVDAQPMASATDRIAFAGWLLIEILHQFTPVGVGLILLGLISPGRVLSWNIYLALLMATIGPTYLLNMLLSFEFNAETQMVFRAYPLIAYLALSVLMATGFMVLSDYLKNIVPWRWPAFSVLFLTLGMISVAGSRHIGNLYSELGERYARTILGDLDADSIFFVTGDTETGTLGYMHHVQGLRKDVHIYHPEALVFGNRLIPALRKATRQQAWQTFFAQSKRPIYFADRFGGFGGTNYGLYFKYHPSPEEDYVFLPEHRKFLQYLLSVNSQPPSDNAFEQRLVQKVLQGFSRQYLGYVMQQRSLGKDIPENLHPELERLEQTFVGGMTYFDLVFNYYPDQLQKQKLIKQLQSMRNKIPEIMPRDQRAKFFEFAAHIELLNEPGSPVDIDAAIDYLDKAVRIWPAHENTAICGMMTLLASQRMHEAAAAVGKEFFTAMQDCQENKMNTMLPEQRTGSDGS